MLINFLKSSGFNSADLNALEKFQSRSGFNWMDLQEYTDVSHFMQDIPVLSELVPILTDENSNYICAYKEGALFGKVCYFTHEETSIEPKFKSIESLIFAIENDQDGNWLPDFPPSAFDYPPQENDAFGSDEKKVISLLREAFEQTCDDDIKTQIAFSIMALTPRAYMKDLYPFLDDEDMYIQERAIQMMGYHQYQPAQAKLEALQKSAQYNGQQACAIVLKKIRGSR